MIQLIHTLQYNVSLSMQVKHSLSLFRSWYAHKILCFKYGTFINIASLYDTDSPKDFLKQLSSMQVQLQTSTTNLEGFVTHTYVTD